MRRYIDLVMSLVLYRKYRSQTFDELVGQEHITSILKNAVAQDQISHAYLFYGSRGLGKTSAARILSKAVNCTKLSSEGNPCDKCENCVAIREGRFLDLIEIDAASNRGIDQIRELKEKIEFSPSQGKYKVYIIDEVHMLTTEAFNALLKTLEEPPKHAIFILCTTEIHKVPPTILSRCQRFDFRLGSDQELKSHIEEILKKEKVTAEDRAVELVVENARGSYRDALSLLEVVISGQKKGKDPKNITEEEVRVALGLADSTMAYFFLEKIVNAEPKAALDLVQELATKGVNLAQFVKFVLSVLREILVGELRDEIGKLEYSFAKKLDRKSTLALINLFVEAEKSLKDSIIPTLPLEILVADSLNIFSESAEVEVETNQPQPPKPTSSNSSGNGGKPSSIKIKPAASKEKPSSKVADMKSVSENPEPKGAIKSDSNFCLSKEDVEKQWPKVMKELRVYNSHLYAFIGRASVCGIENGILKLCVPFDFHKDRLESPKSREAISAVFGKIFGHPVGILCEVDNSIRKTANIPDVVVLPEESNGDPRENAYAAAPGRAANVYDSVSEVFGKDLIGA